MSWCGMLSRTWRVINPPYVVSPFSQIINSSYIKCRGAECYPAQGGLSTRPTSVQRDIISLYVVSPNLMAWKIFILTSKAESALSAAKKSKANNT